FVDSIDDMPQKAQKTGMVDAREAGHFCIVAIDGKEVLVQIVGSDAEEVRFGQLLFQLSNLRLEPKPFFDGRYHRGHDLDAPESRRPQQGAELCAKEVAVFLIDAHSAESQIRIRFSRKIQVWNGLVATNVDGANDDWPLPCRARDFAVNRELLFLIRRPISADEEHLGAKESNRLGAIR